MAQIVPKIDLAERLGSGLSSGLQSGVEKLAEQKLQQIQRERQGAAAEKFKLPREFIDLSPQVQQQYIKNKGIQENNAVISDSLSTLLGKNQSESSSRTTPAEQPIAKTENKIETPGYISEENFLKALQTPGLSPKDAFKFTQLYIQQEQAKATREATEKREQRKEEQKKEELSLKEQKRIDKETAPYYSATIKEGKAAKEGLMRLNKIEKLTKEGNLGVPIFNSLIKTIDKGIFGIGIDLKGLMTADAQELDKLSTDFVKNAKDFFGSRITDNDLKAFMQTIPTLSQSNAGRIRVINNMRLFLDAAALKDKTMKQIIKENNGKRPANLDILVEERIAPELDLLADKFKESSTELPPRFTPINLADKLTEGILHY